MTNIATLTASDLDTVTIRADGYYLVLRDDLVLDTRCSFHECAEHLPEYVRALQFVYDELGVPVSVSDDLRDSADGVPLLRGRFKLALQAYRLAGGTTTEPQRQRLHYAAGKLFARDDCPLLAVEKVEQSHHRMMRLSLDRVFQLRDFTHENGRFPREGSSDAVEKSLAKWLAKQRKDANPKLCVYLNRHVPAWRWAGRDGAWRLRLSQAQGFIETHGRMPNRKSKKDSAEASLGAWVHNQQTARNDKARGEKKGRALSDEHQEMLERLLPAQFPLLNA